MIGSTRQSYPGTSTTASVSGQPVGINMERAASSWEYVNETITMKADFIQLQKPIKPEIREYTRKLKAHKIRINYYGTDSADELRQLFDAGVDFPLVNDVGRLIKVAEQLGIQL